MKGQIVAQFVDKYGDIRALRRVGKRRIAVAKNTDTVSHKMNRVAASMIGQAIKTKRISRGFSLEELCVRANLVSATPKSRMWEIENAIRQEGLRMGTLYALAHALGCEVYELLPTVANVSEMAGVKLQAARRSALCVVK